MHNPMGFSLTTTMPFDLLLVQSFHYLLLYPSFKKKQATLMGSLFSILVFD